MTASSKFLPAVTLMVLSLTLSSPAVSAVTLKLAQDSNCDGLSSWGNNDCRMFAGSNIPAITVGLFGDNGFPCCGETVVSVSVKVQQSGADVAVSGFTDRDSTAGAAGSDMQVTFEGLSLSGTEIGRNFSLSFSTFYQGDFLTFESQYFSIFANEMQLMNPWGTFGAAVPQPVDDGPWRIGEELPRFTVALTAFGQTAESLTADQLFHVGARLFNKGDSADISESSLYGTTVAQVSAGVAVFEGLYVRGVAGAGFRMAFFLQGSELECLPGQLRVTCEETESRRGPAGGLGGYAVETATSNITIVPDKMTLGTFGTHPALIRVDETLLSYRLSFFDSLSPSTPFSGFQESDGLSVTAELQNSQGTDITATNLRGTTTVSITGASADFIDLHIVGTAGRDFMLTFKPSWNSRCVLKLVDPTCSGGCCVQSTPFFLFPYSMRAVPDTALTDVTEGAVMPGFTVSFLDYSNNVLSGIVLADGLSVNAYLRKRGRFTDGLVGASVVPVNAGIARFDTIELKGIAGSDFSLLFQEEMSQMSDASSTFVIHAASLSVDLQSQAAVDIDQPLGNATVSLLGGQGQVLSIIVTEDNFLVTVTALESGTPYCCLSGVTSRVANDGVAVFPGLSLPANGQYVLQFTYRNFTANSNSFQVNPDNLVVDSGIAANAQFLFDNPNNYGGVGLDNLTVTYVEFRNFAGSRVTTAVGLNITVELYVKDHPIRGTVKAPNFLIGTTTKPIASGNQAVFDDLRVDSTSENDAAGSNGWFGKYFRLRFTYTSNTAPLIAWSETFELWPARIGHALSIGGVLSTSDTFGLNVLIPDDTSNHNCCSDYTSSDGYTLTISLSGCNGNGLSVSLQGTTSINDGSTSFSGLSLNGIIGTNMCDISVSDNQIGQSSLTTTNSFSILHEATTIHGFTGYPFRTANIVANFEVRLLNGAGSVMTISQDSSEAFEATFTMFHHGESVSNTKLNNTLHSSGTGVSIPVSGSGILISGLGFNQFAGSNVTLRVVSTTTSGTLPTGVLTPPEAFTVPFTIFPDKLSVLTSSISGQADALLPAIPINCLDNSDFLLSMIQVADQMTINVTLFKSNGDAMPACSSSLNTGCLDGTLNHTVSNGTVSFNDLIARGLSGTNFYFRFLLLGGGPSVDSSAFSIFPEQMTISEGQTDFTGQHWVQDRGNGDYKIKLLSAGGAAAAGIATSDGFEISVSLLQNGQNISRYLQGTTSFLANWDGQAHAVFTDLVVAYAGSGLSLRFEFTDSTKSVSLLASTGSFRAVPYALRIVQSCHNGRSMNTSGSIEFGYPLLECVENDPDAPEIFGAFGYLTGYYYYDDNDFVGPLLRNVRGVARVPKIEVIATNLNKETGTSIVISDNFTISVGLSLDSTDYTSALTGTKSQVLSAGKATFSDLSITTIAECSSSCTVLLRFSLDGALCTDTWCTNVTLQIQPSQVTPPHQLGSHPAFPGSSTITGTLFLPGITNLDSGSGTILIDSIVIWAGVPTLSSADVSILSNSSTARRLLSTGLDVIVEVKAPTFAAANVIVTKLTYALDAGVNFFASACIPSPSDPICSVTPTLKSPFTRTSTNFVLDGRVETPTFTPIGSAASCVEDGSCIVANLTLFSSFSVTITSTAGTTIFYSVDTCPTPTEFCSATGTVLDGQGTSTATGSAIQIFASEPATTILPVGLQNASSPFVNPSAAQQFGASGQRVVGVMPSVFTVKAFARDLSGSQKQGFQSSITYALPPQASTPEIELKARYDLGACNDTAFALDGINFEPGGCIDLHVSSNASICNAALEVPCRPPTSPVDVCTAGSLGYTIPHNGTYDGVLSSGGRTTLQQSYAFSMTSIVVASVSDLGFTNDGPLLVTRQLRVGVNGQGGIGDSTAVTVTAVNQASNTLTVIHDSSKTVTQTNAGEIVELLDVCSVGAITDSVTVGLTTTPASAKIYYTIDGSEPSQSSFILGSSGQLSIAHPGKIRAIGAGTNLMNSFGLAVDFVTNTTSTR